MIRFGLALGPPFAPKPAAHPCGFFFAGAGHRLAKQAVREAVAKNVQAGVPTTILLDGRVQTLDATDPRLIPLVTGRSVNVRAS